MGNNSVGTTSARNDDGQGDVNSCSLQFNAPTLQCDFSEVGQIAAQVVDYAVKTVKAWWLWAVNAVLDTRQQRLSAKTHRGTATAHHQEGRVALHR